jgi:uncharacterized membrane protein
MFLEILSHADMSTMETKLGQFHPLILHFPIVLFTAALICDLLNYIGVKKTLSVGHWLVITAVLMCIPTIITGLEAAESFDPNDAYIAKHRLLGYVIGVAGSFYAGLRIAAMRWHLHLNPALYAGISLVIVALVSWTSDYGGLITRGVTPFSSREESRDATTSVFEDSPEVAQMNPYHLTSYLTRKITVKDVVPIFQRHHCSHCHSDNFSSNGEPHNFFGKDPKYAFLSKNPDGTLANFSSSNFYQTVILNNQMPKSEKGVSLGLSPSERLILLRWLENGAPFGS